MGFATAAAVATSLASAGASAKQAANTAGFAKEAKRDSELAFKRAMNELTANKFAGLSLPTEAYELEREAMLSSGQQIVQQAIEGEGRGVGAAAGRVQLGVQQGQRQIAGAMGEDLMKLEGLTAQEEARLSAQRANLELAQAEGTQAAAAQFGAQSDAALTGAFSSLASAGQQYLKGTELYKEGEGKRELDKLNKEYQKAAKNDKLGTMFQDSQGKPLTLKDSLLKLPGYGDDLSKIQGMSEYEMLAYLADNPELVRKIREAGFDMERAPSTAPKTTLNDLRNFRLQTPSLGFTSPLGF